MKQVKIIKKKDDYTMEYEVGDICKVTGTWYGGVHIEGKTGIPVSIDREEYIELDAQGKPEQAAAENVRMDEQNGHSESKGDEAAAEDVLERDIEVEILFDISNGNGYQRKVRNTYTKFWHLHSIQKQVRNW